MIGWGKLLLALVSMLASLIAYVRERKLLKAGEEQALARVLKEQLDEITKALQARHEASIRNAAVDPTISLPDDGFRRD